MAFRQCFLAASALSRLGASEALEDIEEMSVLQHNARRTSGGQLAASRVALAVQQLEQGAARVCVPVAAGEEAPVAGLFAARGQAAVAVAQGTVAATAGEFCIGGEALALLQRAYGASSQAELEAATASKDKPNNSTENKKWWEHLFFKKSVGGSDSVAGDYVSSGNVPQACSDTVGVGDAICGAVDKYGCSTADINKACGSLENSCCADADGLCDDGDDSVKCSTVLGAGGNDYGELALCSSTGSTGKRVCYGWGNTGEAHYGCTLEIIVGNCGSTTNACCMQTSCSNGSDDVQCIEDMSGQR